MSVWLPASRTCWTAMKSSVPPATQRGMIPKGSPGRPDPTLTVSR
jgi:hypothetical protein